jgi:hypothetical protein
MRDFSAGEKWETYLEVVFGAALGKTLTEREAAVR